MLPPMLSSVVPVWFLLRQIHSFGGMSFQIAHALFYALRNCDIAYISIINNMYIAHTSIYNRGL
jgi:hypothetical protein